MTLSPNISLLFNLGISCFELLSISLEVRSAKKAMGLSLKQYVQHIIQLGGGLPLDAIRQNKVKELDFYNRDLTNAEVREIANVLISNRSLKTMELNWENLSDENKIVFLTTKHKCIINSKLFLLSSCENGNLDMVQAFIENKTSIQLNAKENDEDNSALYTLGFSYATMNQNNSNDLMDEVKDFMDILAANLIDEGEFKLGRLDVIYGAPALLNGCKKGTLSLEDATVLIDELSQDANAYLQDTEGINR